MLIKTEDKGYLLYDYVEHNLVSQGHSSRMGEKGYKHISVNEDGEVLFMLPGGEVRTGHFPEYKCLPDPMWEMKPFKTTKELIQECKCAVDWIESLEPSIDKLSRYNLKVDEKLRYMIIQRLKDIKRYYKNSFRDYYEYLRIAAKTGLVLEPKWIDAHSYRFTNQNIKILQPDKDGLVSFGKMPKIFVKQTMQGAALCLGDKILTEVRHSYSGIIGISEDYCYLVCDNRNNKKYKYQLFQLEWNYEERK